MSQSIQKNMGKLPYSVIMGYSAAAIGYNLLFGVLNSFLMYYFTDVLLISAAAGGTILLLARLWDGINDPLMGSIVERTQTKMGRYRPFLLWGAAPLAVFSVLTYVVPGGSTSFRVIFAGAAYILFGMAYTFCNIPYMAMQSTITSDGIQRTRLITVKSITAMIAAILGASLFKPLVDRFDNEVVGFPAVMAIFSVIALVTILIAFKSTKNHAYHPGKEEANKNVKFREKLQVVTKNPAALLIMSVLFVTTITQSMMTSTGIYYFTYNIGRPDLVGLSMALSMVMLLSMFMVPMLQKKFEKAEIFRFGLLLSIFSHIAFYFVPYDMISLILFLTAVKAFSFGFIGVLIWAMVADCVDFGHWKTGNHSAAIVFSFTTFLQKAGMALGGGLLGLLLAWLGYQPGVSQSIQTLNGIRLLLSLIPAVVMLLAFIILLFYKLDKKTMNKIQEDIRIREE